MMPKRPLKRKIPRTQKRGLMPGSLVYVGKVAPDEKVQVRMFDYNSTNLQEIHIEDLEVCREFRERKDTVTWLDVDGIHNPAIMEKVGQIFGIHPLVLEDVMNSTGRPKVEFFDDYTFLSTKMIEFGPEQHELHVEHFCIVMGDNFLITFQERKGDNFDSVRDRIRSSKGKARSAGTAYLAYMLLDVMVDNYIAVSDNIAEEIEQLETLILNKPVESALHRILDLRKELMDFKKGIDPLRESINAIRNELSEDIAKYYRDLYDHIVHEIDNLNFYQEMLTSLMDLYHSSITYRTNTVMKVLTVITTIFVPLTFIVGVYGMNFAYQHPVTGEVMPYNMPELYSPYGYLIAMSSMLFIVLGMLYYFRRKGWL
jgi:magnesium transporter